MYVLAFIFVRQSEFFENDLWIGSLFFTTSYIFLDLCTEGFRF